MEYVTTKEECENKIEQSGCICSGCGIETVDNSNNPTFWSGCMKCSMFDYGVLPIIFDTAKKLVTERYYIHYSYMGSNYGLTGEQLEYWLSSQIKGTTSIVRDVLNIYNELNQQK